MLHAAMLRPVVALAAWTLVMLGWTLATRLPAMKAAGVRLGELVGGTGKDADGVLPKRAQWKAHNYNHLHEQPTLFYAVALAIALAGADGPAAVALAWAYVALRVAHSLVQAVWNRVSARFALFIASSAVLAALVAIAAVAVF